jgi:hypothetical protein
MATVPAHTGYRSQKKQSNSTDYPLIIAIAGECSQGA